MEFRDRFKLPQGRLIYDVFVNGSLVEHFDEKNLVVSGMAGVMASLLGGGDGAVTQIGFGTSGTPPSLGNATLSAAFLKGIGAVEYPSAGMTKFNFTLENAEGNGLAIMEFGLMTAGNVLVARRVRSAALNKNAAIRLAGAWLIQF